MKTTIAVLALLFFTRPIYSITGNGVGGGGIAEKNLVYAYLNLPSYLDLCMASELCALEKEERETLQKILKARPQELPVDQILQFQSESESPGFFKINGQIKIAKTEYRVGAPIYINTDLLYLKNRTQEVRPLTLSAAAALLVHELGHHLGLEDHLKLDILGSKVQRVLSGSSQQINGGRTMRDIAVTVVDLGTAGSFSQLLIGDSDALYDLTSMLRESVSCGYGGSGYRAPNKPTGLNLWNAHWDGVNYSTTYYGGGSYRRPISEGETYLRLAGTIEKECATVLPLPGQKVESVMSSDYFRLEFMAARDRMGKWKIVPDSFAIGALAY